jgi:very-short-patch-repair endonuclease
MAKKKSVASILRSLKRGARRIPKTRAQKEAYIKGMAKKMDKNPTAPEKSFALMLEELGIEYETQKIVGGKIYDFYVPEKNMLIEVDGDFWHAKDKSLNEMTMVQKKTFFNDLRKNAIAKNNGYELERVWEGELSDQYELIKSRFKYLLTD